MFSCFILFLPFKSLREWNESLFHLTMLQIFRDNYYSLVFFHHLLNILKIFNCYLEFCLLKTCQIPTSRPEHNAADQDTADLPATFMNFSITKEVLFFIFSNKLAEEGGHLIDRYLYNLLWLSFDFWLRFALKVYMIKYIQKRNEIRYNIRLSFKNTNYCSN